MAGKKKTRNIEQLMWGLYALLFLLIVLYIVDNNIAFAAAVVVLIVAILVLEFSYSVRTEGAKKSVIDIGIAVLAVVILFVILMVALDTTSPINVVTSCSMLPTLSKGEMLLLHGIPNVSAFVASRKIPVVNMSQSTFDAMMGNFSNEFLAYYAYDPANRSDISEIIPEGSDYPIALYNTKCIYQYGSGGVDEPYDYYRCYVGLQPSSDIIKYGYQVGNIIINNTYYSVIYTSTFSIANTTIVENYSNPIIVYKTNSSDEFPEGDIIHRAVAAIRVGSQYYILTKGDNNEGLDIQFANYPPSQNDVVGYFAGGLPYLGYLKLIVSGDLAPDPQCGEVIQH